MSIWVSHQTLTPEQEEHILERTNLTLPFDGLPDLSRVTNPQEARRLLALLHPDEPPESITLRFDRFWNKFYNMQIEDIIAVPLKTRQLVALAEVIGRYQYQVGAQGEDIHLIPVKWYPKLVPMRKFGKHKEIFYERFESLYEVTLADARSAVRDHLPHSYNRFRRWKWLLGLFFIMNLVRFCDRNF